MAILITDGNERATLAVTRSLGQRGIAVYVGAESSRSLAGASRYCAGSFQYPSPWNRPEEYVDCVLGQARQRGAAGLLPMTDLAVELLGTQDVRDQNSFRVLVPPLEQYHALSDKYRLMQWAAQNGIPIPVTHCVPGGNVEQVLPLIQSWPVVIKPGRSVIRMNGRITKATVRYAEDSTELLKTYAENPELQEPSLIQSRIEGQGVGIFGLFDQGLPRALFAHRRLREKPPSGGVSVLRESIPLPEPMTKYAIEIAQSVRWHGVAMMEFKVDQTTGIPYLMEVNGRFWGSLQLAIDAGIDFPWLLYQWALTGTVPDVQPYRVAVRSRWWLGDVDHMWLRLRHSAKELHLPPGSPSRLAAVGNFLNVFGRQTKGEVLRLRDPLPGVLELQRYIWSLCVLFSKGSGGRVSSVWNVLIGSVWSLALRCGFRRRAIKRALSQDIRAVLVLCSGNICRSPFAAEILKVQLGGQVPSVEVFSAGLETTAGHPAHPLAIDRAQQRGIDLRSHRTTVVSKQLVQHADLIVVMERVHESALLRQYPEAKRKSVLLGSLSSHPIADIQDPYGGTPEQFDRCYGLIAESCGRLLGTLRASHNLQPCDRHLPLPQ